MKLINPVVGIFNDTHYGTHRNSEIWHKIAIEHAKWARDEFKKRGVVDIIWPGDVFNDRNDIAVNTLAVVAEIFDILKDFNMLISTGNHDSYLKESSEINSISVFRGWKNVTIIDKPVLLESWGKKIMICPWGTLLEQIEPCDIIFGHFEITSFKMNSYKICNNGMSTKSLLEKAPLVISGHFHHRDTRSYDNGTIVYTGSPYQLDWGDYNTEKGIYTLDLTDNKLEFIENTISPKFTKFHYRFLEEKMPVTDIQKLITGNIVKFIVDKEIDANTIDLVVRKLVGLKPTEFSIEYDIVTDSKLNPDDLANKEFNISVENSIAEFIDVLEIKHKDKVKAYVTELYHKVQNA